MSRPVGDLPGVGPQVAARLKALGILVETDLLFHRPLRYEDRTRITPMNRVRPDARVQVEGRVMHQEVVQRRRRMLLVTLADDSGQITLRYFRFYPSQLRMFRVGNRIRCFGDVRFGPEGFEMAHPECRVLGAGTDHALPEHLTPVYPVTQGLARATLTGLIDRAVERVENGQLELIDPLVGLNDLMALDQAVLTIHRPGPGENLDALADGYHRAVQRLACEELLAHHLALARLNRARQRQHAVALGPGTALRNSLLERVGFEPTAAQRRVVSEIVDDLVDERPMRRLLQGDVGSGKTLVAASAMLTAVAAGRQAAIVAPTEILAEQHFNTLSGWLEPLGLKLAWLAGKVKGKARRQALEALAGEADIAIGTHALFQAGVRFRDLALIVVDEQHRFGVHQRLSLAAKGSAGERVPHQLVMTATPIPRTLAMTAYAGLEVSVIDELPPGRKPVTTVAISQGRREEIIERLRRALAEGRQAYWVCPLIEESDLLEAQAAESTASELERALPGFSVGLIHGRMKAAEKQDIMARFSAGDIDLLVATTVIEVGVDVPNASLMMIENAERLGLSQLHQLRGRVGRGSAQAACVLIYKPPLGDTARARLETMRETTDGFVIAEKDLELRGPGEVLGTRQTGMLRFRVADLGRDAELLDPVRNLAERLDRGGADIVIERWIGEAEQFVDV
ncbi:ATP-dependent DNA helicase RecG [Wenzhouxiangella sp. AB-CW3]|uniref:ATP-dependent DNA helicase RecG n=1 Tax=Wenzhouxiangella sp. AB-CW3 TaxID=2771012 RepID=UPI00168A76FE|nr:ATP-dependent DNA helicase RecG [Wenzhouxiangella sp. AB-CW3]QOC22817.1 ATP-dependent DNA helicase RecG [Wenzhouxiangella sp. AB-CW3]